MDWVTLSEKLPPAGWHKEQEPVWIFEKPSKNAPPLWIKVIHGSSGRRIESGLSLRQWDKDRRHERIRFFIHRRRSPAWKRHLHYRETVDSVLKMMS